MTEELELIEEVKNKMAKYKINIPIKRLLDGLLTPDLSFNKNQMVDFPAPGYGLIENPFFVEGKKKKKKKK